eukprot:GHVQ01033076.1.p1 GENE.GHVQ01033076.1~~GHVQ01033076.1.p1  ORF type:complete len:122 (-),score=12.42 GHVQ01033076.1:812-1177(-)
MKMLVAVVVCMLAAVSVPASAAGPGTVSIAGGTITVGGTGPSDRASAADAAASAVKTVTEIDAEEAAHNTGLNIMEKAEEQSKAEDSKKWKLYGMKIYSRCVTSQSGNSGRAQRKTSRRRS